MKRILMFAALLLVMGGTCQSQYTTRVSHIVKFTPVPDTVTANALAAIYFYGDTMVVELDSVQYKLLLSGPADGQSLVWDSANGTWSAGGAGAAVNINDIGNASNDGSIDMGAYTLQMFFDDPTLPGYTGLLLEQEGTDDGRTTFMIENSESGSATDMFKAVVQNGNYILIDSGAHLTYGGSATVNANRWKNSSTFDKASQHAQTAYKDAANTFTTNQTITYTGTSPALGATITGNGNALQGVSNGSSKSGVYGYNTSTGYGVRGLSYMGTGVIAASTQGTPFIVEYNGTTVLTASSSLLYPATTGEYGLGFTGRHFDQLYVDSLFLGATEWKVEGLISGKAYFDTTDTARVSGLGTDTTWNAQVTLASNPGRDVSYFATLTNTGELYVVSRDTSVNGVAVYYLLTKRNN